MAAGPLRGRLAPQQATRGGAHSHTFLGAKMVFWSTKTVSTTRHIWMSCWQSRCLGEARDLPNRTTLTKVNVRCNPLEAGASYPGRTSEIVIDTSVSNYPKAVSRRPWRTASAASLCATSDALRLTRVRTALRKMSGLSSSRPRRPPSRAALASAAAWSRIDSVI